MIQNIEYVGSGPPTYLYSKRMIGASDEYYRVFASDARGYDRRHEQQNESYSTFAEKLAKEKAQLEEIKTVNKKIQTLQEAYQCEFGRSALFLKRF